MKNNSLKSVAADLRLLWRESAGSRAIVAAISLGACLSVGLSLLFIWITKRIVDAAVGPLHSIAAIDIAMLVGCLLAQLAVPAVRRRLEAKALTRYSNRMRARLLDHLLQAKWTGSRGIHTADAISRIQTDVDTLSSLTCAVVPGILAVLLQLAGATAFIAVLDARLALAVIFIMPLALVVSKVYVRRTRRLTDSIRRGQSQLQTFLQESLVHRTLLSTLMELPALMGRFNATQDELTRRIIRRNDISIFSSLTVTAGFMAGYAVTFVWSAWGLTTGAVTFGMMTAFLQLVAQVQRPAVDLAHRVPAFINASVALERIGAITSLEREDYSAPAPPRGAPARLRLDRVSYSYPDDAARRRVVSGLTHEFRPGTITGVIGPTGVGKTTLIRLLLGLVEPTEGSATATGSDGAAHAVTPALRRNIVYVPQGNTLMYGTVRSNLLLGNPGATEEMMRSALTTAAADFVMELPAGLDTECLEGGVGFSEGQAQRIAIARGLLKGGSIILLDEPTSALDPATEIEFMQRLRRWLPPTATVIIVTHRPAVLDFCTDLLELDAPPTTNDK